LVQKCPGFKVSWVQSVLGPECPGSKVSWVQSVLSLKCPGSGVSWVQSVLGVKCPGFKVSWVHSFLGPKCPGSGVSWVQSVLGPECPGSGVSWVQSVLGLKCPGSGVSWVQSVLGPECPGFKVCGSGCASWCKSVSTAWLRDTWSNSAVLSHASLVSSICDLLTVVSCTSHESDCRHTEDARSVMPVRLLGTLSLTISKTTHTLSLSTFRC